jgi:putative flavoprotein involved in K+ transport
MDRVPVLVIGAGSAGLAISHELMRHGIEHLVVDRARIGQSWRERWDSFCLVTPNWSIRLPGGEYAGPDPDGYLPRDEVVAYLEDYAAAFDAPVREGVSVQAIERRKGRGFEVRTSATDVIADRIVLATGAYQRLHRPPAVDTLPASLPVIGVDRYRSPEALPPGGVLIVGSAQSGCQIAEELAEAGRDVVLSCGRATWAPRRIGGLDVFWWMQATGFADMLPSELPSPAARLVGNVVATGRHGGHDLNLGTLQALGVTLAGRFRGAEEGHVVFADDLDETFAWGMARYRELGDEIANCAWDRGITVPGLPELPPPAGVPPARVSIDRFGSVILAGGFRPDDRSLLPWANAFDDLGFPIHEDGESTVVPGLHFVGVHFLRKRSSSILLGVGDDAVVVADRIAGRLA